MTVAADYAAAVAAVEAYRDAAHAAIAAYYVGVKEGEAPEGADAYAARACSRAASDANAALVSLLYEGNDGRTPVNLVNLAL